MRLDPITLTKVEDVYRVYRSSNDVRNQVFLIPRKRSTLRIGLPAGVPGALVMPDDHSEVVPLLPIPNRKVKRFSADDIAGSRVKVGHRQAINTLKASVE